MYNAERYIGTCLDSILNAGLPDGQYEIVVVNDGSKDSGPEIAQKFAEDYPHITYLSQENQGQSTARNNGIRNCHGEYVWCVDSDDKLNNDAKQIIPLLNSYSVLDILAVRLHDVYEDGSFISDSCTQPTVKHNAVLSGRNAVLQGYNPSSVCALIVRRQLMIDHELFFYVGITHQDVELSYRLISHAKSVVFSEVTPYVYIYHNNSTSKSAKPEKKIKYLSDECIVMNSFSNLAKEFLDTDSQLSKCIDNRIDLMHFGMAYNLFLHRHEWKNNGINKAVINKMREAGRFPLHHHFGSWKKNLMSYLLNCTWLYS